ncbi:MAG: hypothetical protein OXN17_10355 [Candidatus Poribacteria bacterium]|nr:hypothetical protein [Candidatus Poribacteria bacterium]
MRIQLELNGPASTLVNASIRPITFTTAGFHVDWESLATMREVEPQKSYAISTFRGFLPLKAVAVGEYWDIDPETVLELLNQFTENPRLESWIGDDEGKWASLRAYNDDHAEIVFRIHAVFVWKDGFFTPSQFAGSLIIDRRLEKLDYFEMSVPPSTLNFDAGREFDDGFWAAESGFCRIEMTAGKEATQALAYSEEISMEEARLGLARQFYPAQFIEWVTLEEAKETAIALDRPIHVVSTDGTFMDESC